MKKGQIRTGVVESLKFPNKAVVRLEGESADAAAQDNQTRPDQGTALEYCMVKGALPGQRVSLTVTKVRNGKGEGRLREVLEKSPLENGGGCVHGGVCGGCAYISMSYEESLKIKERQVHDLLMPVLEKQKGPWVMEPIQPSPVCFGYRNKMEFSFGDEVKDGPLALGMHKRGSFYDVVSVENCRIVDGDYRKILRATLAYFSSRKLPFYHRYSHEGYLRHLLVRKASRTGRILVALVTTAQLQFDLDEWKELLLGLPLEGGIDGILHMQNDSVADTVQSDRTQILYGQDFFYEKLLGLTFKISTFSFFQTNTYGAEVLYRTVQEYIGSASEGKPAGVVYDLYSGTGTIAQLMAPVAEKVIGVEIVGEAVEAARENAARNHLHNCMFIEGDVLQVLDDIAEKPDYIILDPPRDGIHPKALRKIIAYGVERMVYVSCKPTSLARDLEVFLENGYEVERCVPIDQFPFTANIETVCLLSNRKSKPDTHVKLSLSMDDYYRIKEEGKNNQ